MQHIVLAQDKTPFKSENAAESAIVTRKDLDDQFCKVIPIEDGFGILVDTEKKKPVEPEKYYKVKFSGKQSKTETDDVELAVNGEWLIIQREEEVIIPGRYKEAADHATYQQFRQMPGKTRKVVATIKVYPYELIQEVAETTYKKMLKEGTKLTRKWVSEHPGEDLDA